MFPINYKNVNVILGKLLFILLTLYGTQQINIKPQNKLNKKRTLYIKYQNTIYKLLKYKQ